MNVYIAWAHKDINAKQKLMSRLVADGMIAKQIATGKLRFVEIGAQNEYSFYDEFDYNIRAMSVAIGDTEDIGIMFVGKAVSFAHSSARAFENLRADVIECPDVARRHRKDYGTNVLVIGQGDRLKIAKEFIKAIPNYKDYATVQAFRASRKLPTSVENRIRKIKKEQSL